jgi:hypothetical protein
VLSWLRIRKQIDDVHRVAVRPLAVLESRKPDLFPQLWRSPYCCTITYFWTAVIAEDLCDGDADNGDKLRTLREAFTRLVEDTGGIAYDVMIDLKRVVDLYNGRVDDRHMIYPDYREAVLEDRRPAVSGNRHGAEKEFAYEILLSSYLAANGKMRDLQKID